MTRNGRAVTRSFPAPFSTPTPTLTPSPLSLQRTSRTHTAHFHRLTPRNLCNDTTISSYRLLKPLPPATPSLRYIDSVHHPCESHKAFDVHAPSDSALAQALVQLPS